MNGSDVPIAPTDDQFSNADELDDVLSRLSWSAEEQSEMLRAMSSTPYSPFRSPEQMAMMRSLEKGDVQLEVEAQLKEALEGAETMRKQAEEARLQAEETLLEAARERAEAESVIEAAHDGQMGFRRLRAVCEGVRRWRQGVLGALSARRRERRGDAQGERRGPAARARCHGGDA